MKRMKLQPSCLRVGNYVMCSNKYVSVTHILPLWIESDYSPYGYIEYHKLTPIELTNERLIKFGFVNNGQNIYDLIGWELHLRERKSKDSRQYQASKLADCNVTYVHQLQNLYFALTGKELTWQT